MVFSSMERICLKDVLIDIVKRENIRGANMYVWVIVRETAKKNMSLAKYLTGEKPKFH